MNRAIARLIVLVLVLFGLQSAVPQWVDQAAGSQLHRYFQVAGPTVEVTAIPFWEIASGKFQEVLVSLHRVKIRGLMISKATLDWQNGRVAFGEGGSRRLTVLSPGKIQIGLGISAGGIASELDHSGVIRQSQVEISRGQMGVAGVVRLDGRSLRLAVLGPLSVAPNHQALVFRPQAIDGLKLPGQSQILIFDLARLNLPLPDLSIQRIQLSSGMLRIWMTNRAK